MHHIGNHSSASLLGYSSTEQGGHILHAGPQVHAYMQGSNHIDSSQRQQNWSASELSIAMEQITSRRLHGAAELSPQELLQQLNRPRMGKQAKKAYHDALRQQVLAAAISEGRIRQQVQSRVLSLMAGDASGLHSRRRVNDNMRSASRELLAEEQDLAGGNEALRQLQPDKLEPYSIHSQKIRRAPSAEIAPEAAQTSAEEVSIQKALDGLLHAGHKTAGQAAVKIHVRFPRSLYPTHRGMEHSLAGDSHSTASRSPSYTSTRPTFANTSTPQEDAGAAAVRDWSEPVEQVCRAASALEVPCSSVERHGRHGAVVTVPVTSFDVRVLLASGAGHHVLHFHARIWCLWTREPSSCHRLFAGCLGMVGRAAGSLLARASAQAAHCKLLCQRDRTEPGPWNGGPDNGNVQRLLQHALLRRCWASGAYLWVSAESPVDRSFFSECNCSFGKQTQQPCVTIFPVTNMDLDVLGNLTSVSAAPFVANFLLLCS